MKMIIRTISGKVHEKTLTDEEEIMVNDLKWIVCDDGWRGNMYYVEAYNITE